MNTARRGARCAPWLCLGLVPLWGPPVLAQTMCPGSDEIVLDCNGNGTDDFCDIALGTSADANTNAVPDECDTTECRDPWSGFEPVPPFASTTPIDGIDIDSDGSAWSNPSHIWTVVNQGCPSNQGKALKGYISTTLPMVDVLRGEFFNPQVGERLTCAAHHYRFVADFRYEAMLNPRADWQLMLHDGTSDSDVVLIHWASTQSNFPGVTSAEGGSGRGRILVQNPLGDPTFINTGFTIPLNTCHRVEVTLDNDAPADHAVSVTINETLRVTVPRLSPTAQRMDYLIAQKLPNGQVTGGLNRLSIDNITICRTGAPLAWPDCNANCVDDAVDIARGTSQDSAGSLPDMPDECEPDCNSNGTPDARDLTAGTSLDCNSNGGPDECDVAAGTSLDCDGNGTPEECDLASGASPDCNMNGQPDACDVLLATSADCDRNLVPDECEVLSGTAADCNSNSIPDLCDVGVASAEWSRRPTLGPRADSQMAFDAVRGVTVLFGGYNGSTVRSDTWEWDGGEWTLKSSTGPSASSGMALAYDGRRRVTVLFGGFDSGGTWEWDGSTWIPRWTSGSPPERVGGVMAYDWARGVVVLFGGISLRSRLGDTWEFDGSIWSLRATTGPSPRYGHAMAFDKLRGVTVLFGGYVGAPQYYSGETWEWNGFAWSLRSVAGPEPGVYEMAYDDARSVCVLTGAGEAGAPLAQTWEWNGQDWAHVSDAGLTSRRGQAMAYDSHRHAIVVFGGSDSQGYYGDTWERQDGTWVQRTRGAPTPRSEPPLSLALTYDGARRVSVLFSDSDSHSDFGQTAEWNGQSWNVFPSKGPAARRNHAMTYDSLRKVSVLFGGRVAETSSNETWEWDGSIWEMRAMTGPSARYLHAMAYDSSRGVTILFGGTDLGVPNGETWEWNGTAWMLREATGPLPRSGHVMTYDSLRAITILFGCDVNGETWEWDGAAWMLRSTNGPTSLSECSMTYDGDDALTILLGRNLLTGHLEAWDWNGLNWSQRDPPPTFGAHGLTYDLARRLIVAVNQRSAEVWELTPSSLDCNADGVPDECQNIPPCARVVAATSWRTHGGGVGSDGIAINPQGTVAAHNVTSEPRIGGIFELRLSFDAPPGGPGDAPVTITERTCGDDGFYTAYTGAAVAHGAIDGNELVLTFSPPLENAKTYRLRLGAEITAAPEQGVEVRCLAGDVNSDGRVNATDRSAVVAAWTVGGYSPQTDITLDGRTNAADRAVVVSVWTGNENCAP